MANPDGARSIRAGRAPKLRLEAIAKRMSHCALRQKHWRCAPIRITDHLLFLDVLSMGLRAAVGYAFDRLQDSERQRDELRTATVETSDPNQKLQGPPAHDHSEAKALSEIAHESLLAVQIAAAIAPSVDSPALTELSTKVQFTPGGSFDPPWWR